MSFIVILDSCVIYPMPLCDTLMRVAESGFYRIHFSQEILDGATRNLTKDGRMTLEKAAKFQGLLLKTFPEALVEVPSELATVMTNDPGDRHVLAAAVACKAEIIVTCNLRHFLAKSLSPWNIEAQHPDKFLVDICAQEGVEPLAMIVQKQAEELKRPPITLLELLEKLHQQVPDFASRIVTYFWGMEVEFIAKKYLEIMSNESSSSCRSYSGEYYNIHLTSRRLIITAKDSRGEILISQQGERTGSLTPTDIRRFKKVEKTLEECRKTT